MFLINTGLNKRSKVVNKAIDNCPAALKFVPE